MVSETWRKKVYPLIKNRIKSTKTINQKISKEKNNINDKEKEFDELLNDSHLLSIKDFDEISGKSLLMSTDNDNSILGTMKLMMPVLWILMIALLVIVLGWFLIGFPIGIGTNITM